MVNLLEELFQRFDQSRLLVQLLNGSDVAVGVRTLDSCVTENTSNLKNMRLAQNGVYALNVLGTLDKKRVRTQTSCYQSPSDHVHNCKYCD